MILAILNLPVAPMPPTKLGLNLTLGSGADVVSRGGQLGQPNGMI